jgi:hypothetical protein
MSLTHQSSTSIYFLAKSIESLGRTKNLEILIINLTTCRILKAPRESCSKNRVQLRPKQPKGCGLRISNIDRTLFASLPMAMAINP